MPWSLLFVLNQFEAKMQYEIPILALRNVSTIFVIKKELKDKHIKSKQIKVYTTKKQA